MSLNQLEIDIQKSHELIHRTMFLKFSEYALAYFSTTENINAYLSQETFNKNRALTVLASGDHVFNLIHRGVKEIDAFDINRLTYYVYHLKRAMFQGLPYEVFLNTCRLINHYYYFPIMKEIVNRLKIYLPEDVYEYYRRMIEIIEKEERGFGALYYEPCVINTQIANGYLASKEEYLKCRRKLDDTSVNLYFGDVKEIPSLVPGDYDLILLSNISDYLGDFYERLTTQDFKKYIDLFFRLLKPDGLLINYLYNLKQSFVINDSIITKQDLGPENIGVIKSGINDTTNDGYFRIRKKSN